jgi:hypothetical protein
MLHLDGANLAPKSVPPLLATIRDALVSSHRTEVALQNLADVPSLDLLFERNGTAKMTVEARSPEWLDANGYCLDHSKHEVLRELRRKAIFYCD